MANLPFSDLLKLPDCEAIDFQVSFLSLAVALLESKEISSSL